MSGATLRRFAATTIGMHSQLYDDETSKPLGVVLEPDVTLLPAGKYKARPCAAGILIDAGRRAPVALRHCTEPHARGDVIIGAAIAKADSHPRRIIEGHAEAFDRFVAQHLGEPFDLLIVDPSPDPLPEHLHDRRVDPYRAPSISTPFDP